MKKLKLLLLALVSLSVLGQTNIGNYDRLNIKTKANIMADTFQWEGTIIYKDSLYYTEIRGDSCRFKQLGSDIWSEWIGGGGGDNGTIFNGLFTQLIYGTVTWSGTGLTYDVSQCLYYIMGRVYTSDAASITLDPADATLNRFDVIYVDTLGNVGKITGVPAEDPYEPLVDPLSQLRLTIIYVGAGALTPDTDVDVIYRENVEWATSVIATSAGSAVTFDNTVTPFAGSLCVNVTSTGDLNGTTFKFLRPTPREFKDNDVFVFYMKSSAAFGNKHWITFQWYNGNTLISPSLTIGEGSYGYVSSNSAWQKIAIPMKDFRMIGTTGDNLRIAFIGRWTSKTVKFDNLEIQADAGITDGLTGTGTGDYVTKWLTAKTLGNSIMRNRGQEVGVGDWGASYTKFSIFMDSAYTSGLGAQESRGGFLYAHPTMSWGASARAFGWDVLLTPTAADTSFGIRVNNLSYNSDVAYGLWSTSSSALKNYSFYGDNGRLYNKDSVGFNVPDPEKLLDVDGGAQFRDTVFMQTVPEITTPGPKHYLVVDGDTVKYVEQADSVSYTISAETGTNGAWIKLLGSDGSKDSVLLSENGGIDIVRSDANTITFETDSTTYTLSAEADTLGAWMKITGSDGSADSVLLAKGANMTIIRTDADTITFISTGGTYTQDALADANGAWIRILGSDGSRDSVLLQELGGLEITRVAEDTISFLAGQEDYSLNAVSGTNGAWVQLLGTDGTKDSVFLAQDGSTTITQTDANTITIGSSEAGATYTLSAETGTGGSWIKILGSDGSKDSVLLAESTGMTITRTDANTISFASSADGATYTMSTIESVNGAYVKIIGSDGSKDSVLLSQSTGMTINITDDHTVTFAATAGTNYWARDWGTLIPATGTDSVWGKRIYADTFSDSTGTWENGELSNTNIVLKPSPADGTGSGTIITLTAGENLVFGNVCYVNSSGKLVKADNNALATSYACMMALESISTNGAGKFLVMGTVTSSSWSWTAGDKIWLGVTGGLQNTVVENNDEVSQILGIALSSSTILFYGNLAQAEVVIE